ncbi:thioredoxin [Candidatus Shapirobacteria bacterium CG_4_9_14_0_2_um_filter_39_11]|uniref:Thioredoxin n=1 Tax=Candidatus Shapirobacteria bacterium CG_4_9_14_0_2_um_filter_39_11 TaxID=1974478 RepID=A0A2M8ES41_9BACT|nr:MAG: thioredoxin [Candidatus Shapirobacteria bacterium CG_4_9_14_0_2_um_filter_39_11]
MVILTDENFKKEVLEANLPVLVDFWAPWCGPCQTAGPVIEELAKEYEGKIKVGKLNVDENPKISEKYGILSIPTVIIFKNGEEVKRQVGFVGKEGYINLISNI